jgi:hypothetical protein
MHCDINSRILCKKHWCSCHLASWYELWQHIQHIKRQHCIYWHMSVPTSKIPTVYSRNAIDNVTKPSCSYKIHDHIMILTGTYKVNSAASTSTYFKKDLVYLLVVLWWSCHTVCFSQICIPVKSCIWVKLYHRSWRGLRRGGTKWPLFCAAHWNNTVYNVGRIADVHISKEALKLHS